MSILGEGEIGEIGQIDSAVISHAETGPGRNRRVGEETNIYVKPWVTCYIVSARIRYYISTLLYPL